MAVSNSTCRDFDMDNIIEFDGKVDFSTTLSSSPAVGSDKTAKTLDCKAKCINDPECGIWSMDGSKCNMFKVDADVRNMFGGLVVHPKHMFNSAFPDKPYRYTSQGTKQACRDLCKADRDCNLFTYNSNDGMCTLNKCSSPFPTGYTKSTNCFLADCVVGKEYYFLDNTPGQEYRIVLQFYPKGTTPKKVKFFHSRGEYVPSPSVSRCADFTYTVSSDKRSIEITYSGTKTLTLFNFTDTGFLFNDYSKTPDPAPTDYISFTQNTEPLSMIPNCSPLPPPPVSSPSPVPVESGACLDIFECVKGKEFVISQRSTIIKFYVDDRNYVLLSLNGRCNRLRIQIIENTIKFSYSTFSAPDVYGQMDQLVYTLTFSNAITNTSVELNIDEVRIGKNRVITENKNIFGTSFRLDGPETNSFPFNTCAPINACTGASITVFNCSPQPPPSKPATPLTTSSFFNRKYAGGSYYIEFTTSTTTLNYVVNGYSTPVSFLFSASMTTISFSSAILTYDQTNDTFTAPYDGLLFTETIILRYVPPAPPPGQTCTKGISYCEDGSDPSIMCSDGTKPKCFDMCSDPNDVCPPPFTSKIKFANENDFSQKIIILDTNNIQIGSIQTRYFLRRGVNTDEYFIDTPYGTYYYSQYNVGSTVIRSIIAKTDTFTTNRYIDVRYYFYKKTLIKPVANSTRPVIPPSPLPKDACGSPQIPETTDTISYHCLMFSGVNTVKYYIMKKSKVNVIQSRIEKIYDSFDQMISPYESLKKTDILTKSWSIDSETEQLTVSGSGNISLILEERDYIDLKRIFKTYKRYDSYGVRPDSENLKYRTFDIIRTDVSGSEAYTITFHENNRPDPKNVDYRYLKITRKDTDVSCLMKQHSGDIYRECTNDGLSYKTTGLTFGTNFLSIGDDVNVRFSFMTQMPISDQLGSTFQSQIIDNGTVGGFFLYDSQLLSGLDGYNRCSTVITGGQSSSAVKCTDVYEAAYKCEQTEGAVGFSYNFNTDYATMILFDEQFDVTTNRNDIVAGHSDLVDMYPVFTTLSEDIPDDWGHPIKTIYRDYSNNILLYHNIFPSEKVSPISDEFGLSSKSFEGFNFNPNLNISVVASSLMTDASSTRDGSIYFPGTTAISYTPTQSGSFDSVSRCVFIRSNQPNIGGKIFRGVHFRSKLSSVYTGIGGKLSSHVQINTTNQLILSDNTSHSQLFLYRITDFDNEGVNLFGITTNELNTKFITYKYEKVGLVQDDCYWYIVRYDAYPRKIYLVSFVDENVMIELDLTSDFVYPPATTNLNLRIEFLYDPSGSHNGFTNYCNLQLGLFGSEKCKYEYIGNTLVIFKEETCGSPKKIIKIFKFYGYNGVLYDTDNGNIFTGTNMRDGGSFITMGGLTFLDEREVNLYPEPPEYTLFDSLRDFFVPPVAMGNKDPLDNFLYFLGIVPIPGGLGAAAKATTYIASNTAKTIIRTARIPWRIIRTPLRATDDLARIGDTGVSASIKAERTVLTEVQSGFGNAGNGSHVTRPGSGREVAISKTNKGIEKPPDPDANPQAKPPPADAGNPAPPQGPSSGLPQDAKTAIGSRLSADKAAAGRLPAGNGSASPMYGFSLETGEGSMVTTVLRPPQPQGVNQIIGAFNRGEMYTKVIRSLRPKIPDTPL